MSTQFTPGPWDWWGAGDRCRITEASEQRLVGTAQSPRDADLIAAAPSLYADAEFLCARIRELEGEMTDDGELSRQYFGHVVPAIARMESALAEARGDTA